MSSLSDFCKQWVEKRIKTIMISFACAMLGLNAARGRLRLNLAMRNILLSASLGMGRWLMQNGSVSACRQRLNGKPLRRGDKRYFYILQAAISRERKRIFSVQIPRRS